MKKRRIFIAGVLVILAIVMVACSSIPAEGNRQPKYVSVEISDDRKTVSILKTDKGNPSFYARAVLESYDGSTLSYEQLDVESNGVQYEVKEGFIIKSYTVDRDTYHQVYITLYMMKIDIPRVTEMPDDLSEWIAGRGMTPSEMGEFIKKYYFDVKVVSSLCLPIDVTNTEYGYAYLMADVLAREVGPAYGSVFYVVGLPRAPETVQSYLLDTIYLHEKVGTGSYKSGYTIQSCNIYRGSYIAPQYTRTAADMLDKIKSYNLSYDLAVSTFGFDVAQELEKLR